MSGSAVVRRVSAVAVGLLTAAWLSLLAPAPPAAADVDYVFNVNCPISHFNSDDPIVYPARPGVSHRHAFYGNVTTDAETTTRSLLASTSTCERGFDKADRSAYWVPSLYRKLADGTLQEVRLSRGDQHLSAYYRRSGGSTGHKVKPFPKGLRMVAGDPFATKPQSTLDIAWRCNGDGRDYVASIPSCTGDTVLQAIVGFPDCWDGKHLDSADHRSHMAPSRGEGGSCPSTHPVKLPQLTFEISFKMRPVAGSVFELSSGGRYSLHGDFFAAWDDRVQSALVNSCLNAGRYCENVKLSEVDLSAAGPVISVPEPPGPAATTPPAAGAHLGHAEPAPPSAAPAAAASATRSRPGLPLAAVAVTAAAVAAAAYLRHRTGVDRRRRPR